MKINIRVVKHKGGLLFKHKNLRFDSLEAYDDFFGGRLTVFRNKKVIDTTSKIGEHGTHAPSTVFYGLMKLTGQYINYSLEPKLFLENDLLVIEVKGLDKVRSKDLLESWVSSLQRKRGAGK